MSSYQLVHVWKYNIEVTSSSFQLFKNIAVIYQKVTVTTQLLNQEGILTNITKGQN